MLLIDTVRIVAPDVADDIPDQHPARAAALRDMSAELELWRTGERTETLAWVLPLAGVLAWVGALGALARPRRMLVRLGVVLTVGGVLLLVGLRIGGTAVGVAVRPAREPARPRRDVWADYVDGLRAIAWAGILGGIVLAAAVQAITRDASRLSPARHAGVGRGPAHVRAAVPGGPARPGRWADRCSASRCSRRRSTWSRPP